MVATSLLLFQYANVFGSALDIFAVELFQSKKDRTQFLSMRDFNCCTTDLSGEGVMSQPEEE